jgi:TatD DNase family protein
LALAKEFKKPVVIHCRNAYLELLEILKNEKEKNPELAGVVHFFSGRLSHAEEFFKLGFLISFTGVITFARDYDRVIKAAPLEKIMIETDAPFVAPEPHRSKRNEPLYVRYVCQKIAEIKNLPFEEVARTTTENAEKLFGI